ncbi:MAG: sigma-70 family RNA polymerase sigma factor [Taibaiella sp.]|nr:sigma-70 family RNA polymerase sigma factor [Taibaiella sp.]
MRFSETEKLVDHLFRHEAGKMVAVLSRLFGLHNLQLAEDVVQDAFIKAQQSWKFNNLPDDPAAWLMQVAKNRAIDIIRRQNNFNLYSKELAAELNDQSAYTLDQFFHELEIADSQLRMMFACCHPSLKQEDQVALTLKTVSGFSMQEIARSLLTNEAAIQKRLHRAKEFLKNNHIQLEIPAGEELKKRLETIYTVLYLLFNEGYNSLKADELIRKDLCAEAMRCCKLLGEHKAGDQPSTFALLSLMCFQASRFDSRIDDNNDIILLQQQDRKKWNKELINIGVHYLNKCSNGDELSVYHIESAIAAQHCLAETFADTNWEMLLQLYDMLLEVNPSPAVQLNRAIVLAQLGAIEAAIQSILSITGVEKLLRTDHIYSSVLGELYKRLSDTIKANEYLQQAFDLTPSAAEKKLIRTKMEELLKNRN